MAQLIAIVGGSGSGKTTLATALLARLPAGRAVLMSEDWYYADHAARPGFDPASFDFDDVSARDHALLAEHLTALRAGQAVTAPDYDFVAHRRRPGGHAVAAAEVVLVEGAHLLCTPQVAGLFDLRVFIDTPPDIRFIRRLLRDQAERGRSAESVIAQYLSSVRPGHLRLTEPSRAHADLIVADEAGAVRPDDGAALDRLLAPVLAHPALAALATRA